MTKFFVATVVLQLVAEGKLRLDDHVQRWLGGAVPGGERITIRQLLNHTSGLYNYTDDLLPPLTAMPTRQALRQMAARNFRPWQLVAIATRHPPLFPRGAVRLQQHQLQCASSFSRSPEPSRAESGVLLPSSTRVG